MKRSGRLLKLALAAKTDWRTDAAPEEVREAFDAYLVRHGFPSISEMTYLQRQELRLAFEEFKRIYGPALDANHQAVS